MERNMANEKMGTAIYLLPIQRIGKPQSSVEILRFTGNSYLLTFTFRKPKSLHFCDLGPNGNYRESLKTLRVVSRMPARPFSSKSTYPARIIF